MEVAQKFNCTLTDRGTVQDEEGNHKARNAGGRSQDGRGIGRGDHFLSYKFIERTTER